MISDNSACAVEHTTKTYIMPLEAISFDQTLHSRHHPVWGCPHSNTPLTSRTLRPIEHEDCMNESQQQPVETVAERLQLRVFSGLSMTDNECLDQLLDPDATSSGGKLRGTVKMCVCSYLASIPTRSPRMPGLLLNPFSIANESIETLRAAGSTA